MKLRVFFIAYRLREKTYEKQKLYHDFFPETSVSDAENHIFSRYGTLKGWQSPHSSQAPHELGLLDPKAPSRYAILHSSTLIDPSAERGSVEQWQSVQLELL